MEEEVKNLTKEEILEVIKDFPIKPLGRKLIVTINTVVVDDDELEESTNAIAETQYVIAVGSYITELNPGDKVLLDLEKMSSPRSAAHNAFETNMRIKIDPIQIGDRVYAFVNEGVIKALDNRDE